jgi:transcription elongation factor SPT6
LRQQIRRNIKNVSSRNTLLVKKLLSICIYKNAAGFIRICDQNYDDDDDNFLSRDRDGRDEHRDIHPLDNTRIHPECYHTYDLAQKLCSDSLGTDHTKALAIPNILKQMEASKKDLETKLKRFPNWIDLWENGRPSGDYVEVLQYKDGRKVEKLMPVELDDELSLLQLEEYAADLEKQHDTKRRLQLEQIKEELRYPWLDLRKPMQRLSDSEVFRVVSGESDESLYVGLKIGCQVTLINVRSDNNNVKKQSASVKTDIGLRGFISAYELFDDRSIVVDNDQFDIKKYLQVFSLIFLLHSSTSLI